MSIERRVALHFNPDAVAAGTHVNLSAVRSDGRCLWVAGDETATVERLVLSGEPSGAGESGAGEFGGQREFRLADLVELPGGAEDEADIEGLARSGGYLWAVGSHSVVRRRVRSTDPPRKAIKRLAKLRVDPNRYVIVRMPVVEGADGLPELVREAPDGRTAALLGALDSPNLADALAGDPHLGPFLSIPAKDNGLDVEGLAVHGEAIYVGLRGPVLRGFAVVLELRPDEVGPGRLGLAPIGEDGEPYRKHFLDLAGLGVRDLCPHGRDLLVLAGPSMALDGPVYVYRWLDAAVADTSMLVRGDELTRELVLPYGEGDDHAEGIALMPDGETLLVVYDSPAEQRRPHDHVVQADLVRLPG